MNALKRANVTLEQVDQVLKLMKQQYSCKHACEEVGVPYTTTYNYIKRTSPEAINPRGVTQRRLLKRQRTQDRNKASFELAATMYKSGHTLEQIANQINVSTRTVYVWLQKNNITRPTDVSVATRYSEATKQQAREMILDGIPPKEISDKTGVNVQSIYIWSRELEHQGHKIQKYQRSANVAPTGPTKLKVEKSESVFKMLKSGTPLAEVAKVHNIAYETVKRWAEEEGIDIAKIPRVNKLKDQKLNEVLELHRQGKSKQQIHYDTNISYVTICKWIKEHGQSE